MTEIKAYATAVKHFHPDLRAILDIGGQDTKAILLDEQGLMKKFEMNDKCAAGTGKFLEIMAMTLGVTLEEFGPLALSSKDDLTINNTCTVFAESEVVSLVTQGYAHSQIAHAIHLKESKPVLNIFLPFLWKSKNFSGFAPPIGTYQQHLVVLFCELLHYLV